MITFTHTLIYSIQGVSLHKPGVEESLIDAPDDGVRLLLTDSIDNHWLHGDMSLASTWLMLTGGSDESTGRLRRELLDAKVQEVREGRKPGTFLVLTRSGDVENFTPVAERDEGQFIVTIDGLNAREIRVKSAGIAARVLTALRLSIEQPLAIERAGDFITLFREDGRPIYARTLSAGQPTFWMPLPIGAPEAIEVLYRSTLIEARLGRVYELLGEALSATDPFRAFLWAWTGLEVFLGKVHRQYEAEFNAATTRDAQSEASRQYMIRLQEKSRGRHSIRDSFLVVAAILDADASGDVEDFARIMKTRHSLVHTQERDPMDLPTADTLRLLGKYLKLHVERSIAP